MSLHGLGGPSKHNAAEEFWRQRLAKEAKAAEAKATSDSRVSSGFAPAQRSAYVAAEPLIQALLRAYAPAAAMRTMEGVRFPDGHLPLELAITRGWPASVCKMVRSRRERRRRLQRAARC